MLGTLSDTGILVSSNARDPTSGMLDPRSGGSIIMYPLGHYRAVSAIAPVCRQGPKHPSRNNIGCLYVRVSLTSGTLRFPRSRYLVDQHSFRRGQICIAGRGGGAPRPPLLGGAGWPGAVGALGVVVVGVCHGGLLCALWSCVVVGRWLGVIGRRRWGIAPGALTRSAWPGRVAGRLVGAQGAGAVHRAGMRALPRVAGCACAGCRSGRVGCCCRIPSVSAIGALMGACRASVAVEAAVAFHRPIKAIAARSRVAQERAMLPAMPKMSSSARSRKSKPVVACACGGCGQTTKGTWHPGHDGHCEGWALRVIADVIKIDDVPDAVRAGVVKRLARHGAVVVAPMTQAEKKAMRKAERLAAKTAKAVADVVVPVEDTNVEPMTQVA